MKIWLQINALFFLPAGATLAAIFAMRWTDQNFGFPDHPKFSIMDRSELRCSFHLKASTKKTQTAKTTRSDLRHALDPPASPCDWGNPSLSIFTPCAHASFPSLPEATDQNFGNPYTRHPQSYTPNPNSFTQSLDS